MSRYDDLILKMKRYNLIDDFERLTDESLAKEKEDFPDAPCEYFEFLKDVGYGDIEMDGYLAIFNGLIEPKLIYKREVDEKLKDIFYFGDDLNGFYCGFLINDNWNVAEIDDSFNIRIVNMNFESYIRSRVDSYIRDIQCERRYLD